MITTITILGVVSLIALPVISNISSGANGDPNAQILSFITCVNAAITNLSAIRGNLGATQVLVRSVIESTQANIDQTEEARSTIEDIDSLEAQVNATTAQSQMNLALQAFLLSMQDNFKMQAQVCKQCSYLCSHKLLSKVIKKVKILSAVIRNDYCTFYIIKSPLKF